MDFCGFVLSSAHMGSEASPNICSSSSRIGRAVNPRRFRRFYSSVNLQILGRRCLNPIRACGEGAPLEKKINMPAVGAVTPVPAMPTCPRCRGRRSMRSSRKQLVPSSQRAASNPCGSEYALALPSFNGTACPQ